MYSKSAVTRIQELRYFFKSGEKREIFKFFMDVYRCNNKGKISRDSDNTTSFKIQSYHKINWHN